MNAGKILTGLIILTILLISIAACAPAPTATPLPPTVAPTKAPTVAATTAPTQAATAVPIPAPTAASQSSSQTSSQASSAMPITVTDSAKRSVTISAPPKRIVSLAPSTTEIAFALGLGDRIVGADTYSDYPADAKKVATIKSFPVNYEQVVSLKPDLVLAAGITNADDVKKLADLKLTVLVVGSTKMTFDAVAADITVVAKATGTEAQAKPVIDAMKSKVDALKSKLANAKTKPRVYWELDATDPAKPFTPGPGSFVDDLITLAGGVNVAADVKTPYAQINAEQIIAANPDIIILSDFAYGITVESVKARKGWSVINAIKNDKVFPIDDNLVSRPGPRLVDGLEAAAKLIHPEVFQ
ncbi:MAG: cobalamin-binding protein [Chloroflexi bacterium]|nr:cobalamin-binding protein [Chloroflexota bacterium]